MYSVRGEYEESPRRVMYRGRGEYEENTVEYEESTRRVRGELQTKLFANANNCGDWQSHWCCHIPVHLNPGTIVSSFSALGHCFFTWVIAAMEFLTSVSMDADPCSRCFSRLSLAAEHATLSDPNKKPGAEGVRR